jgi:arsenate reductase (thioredoxin)
MRKPTVLFVCVANSCRSQMAEAIAKSITNDWEVWSAGSNPSGMVHPCATRMMEEIGLDVSSHHSKGVEDVPAREWDYVVTMGCGDRCPTVRARERQDWPIPDPVGLPLQGTREIRDDLRQRILELKDRALRPA